MHSNKHTSIHTYSAAYRQGILACIHTCIQAVMPLAGIYTHIRGDTDRGTHMNQYIHTYIQA